MNIFKSAVEFTFKHEGGHVNDPKDPGGETNLGISDRRDGIIDGKADIDGDGTPDVAISKITIAQAEQLYYRSYWTPCRCDDLPPSVAVVLFDTAVNCGNNRAIKIMQKVLGVKDDGVIGAITINAANKMDAASTARLMADERLVFYRGLKTFSHFGKGWTKRVEALISHVTKLEKFL